MIYLDNAATSWPKPPAVVAAMADFLERAGGNPGRSGHRMSIEAARVVYDVRELVAALFHAPDPLRVIFTPNVTYALNLALRGLLRPGDHVVTSSMEHNAVMRPLRALERQGVRLSIIPCAADGTLDVAAAQRAITPGTRLVVINHASNVSGTILPVGEIAPLANQAGALFLVDAAQTAGVLPIDMASLGIDLLAFTGHKGLQGPPGSGGLVLGAGVDPAQLEPLVRGGTGSRSEFEEQPDDLPDRYESGTANGVGIAGLGAGIRWVLERGVDEVRAHEMALTASLISGLSAIPGVAVCGPGRADKMTAVVSFTAAGRRVSEIGLRLDDEYAVLCRVGLHCAPAAHRTLGTFPEGTVRLAPGPQTTPVEIRQAVRALQRILQPPHTTQTVRGQ